MFELAGGIFSYKCIILLFGFAEVRFLKSNCVEYFSFVQFKPHLLLVIFLRFSSPTHQYIIHAHAWQYKYNFIKIIIYMGQVHNNVLPNIRSSICHTIALHFKVWSWVWQCLSCDMNCVIQTALVTIHLTSVCCNSLHGKHLYTHTIYH